jgi:hypothetical protein
MCWRSPPGPMILAARRSVWTRPAASSSPRSPRPCRSLLAGQPGRTMRTSAVGWATCSWSASRCGPGGTSWSARGAPEPTGRIASRTWLTSTTRTPSGSCWCKTTPNTHTPASLDAGFEPAEAKRLADKLELHDTPRHGSWLQHGRDRAGRAGRAVPGRRLADRARLERAVAAWEAARNASGRGVDWRFTTADARIKLKHLYPGIHG